MLRHSDDREEHTLRDGSRIVLRLIRPDDRIELHALYRRLSPESRYRRFLSVKADLDEDELDYLTRVDNDAHVAIVAIVDTLDLKAERIVGVARFVRFPDDATAAEGAVLVADGMQNRGLGKVLLRAMREAAIGRGVERFRADVLLSNGPMRHLLAEAGAVMREVDDATLVVEVPLGDASEEEPRSLNTILAGAASSMLVMLGRLPRPHVDGASLREAVGKASTPGAGLDDTQGPV
jgi:RimJ/RimL family protein N-acetyltransferase